MTSAIIRFLFFVFLPGSASKFGPDEGTYATLAKYVSEGLPVKHFPVYGSELYNSGRSFFLPSTLLIKLGINELNAVRLTSTIYGFASILILAMTYQSLQQILKFNFRKKQSHFNKESIILVGIFAFIPSNFVWTTIGLRESSSQFWLMTSFYFLLKIYLDSGLKLLGYVVLSIISIMFSFGSRPESAFVFSIVTLSFSIYALIKLRKIAPMLAVLLGFILGQIFTSSWDSSKEMNQNSGFDRKPIVKQDVSDGKEREKSVISDHELANNLRIFKFIEDKRNLNSIGAESALPQTNCVDQSQDFIGILKCNSLILPYRLFTFLFRPLFVFDEGTLFVKLASLENLVWLVIIPFSLFVAFRRDVNPILNKVKIYLATFILVYSSAAALYEGNLGTAFRHKSLIFWPVILILLLSWRKKLEWRRVQTY